MSVVSCASGGQDKLTECLPARSGTLRRGVAPSRWPSTRTSAQGTALTLKKPRCWAASVGGASFSVAPAAAAGGGVASVPLEAVASAPPPAAAVAAGGASLAAIAL